MMQRSKSEPSYHPHQPTNLRISSHKSHYKKNPPSLLLDPDYSMSFPISRGSPTSPTSPLSLPPLMPDSDDDCSPSPSFGFLTPLHSPTTLPRIIDGSSHTALASLSALPSPDLKALRQFSPPHSPKGHPLRPAYTRTKVISNPYPTSSKYTTTAGRLARIPRRLRPVSMFIFCFSVLGVVFLIRALSHPTELEVMIAQRKAFALERRVVHMNGLMNINAPAAQSNFGFQNEKDELLALINFITATAANALPPLDPHQSLDPTSVLDFDPAHPHADADFALLKTEINNLYPIVLFGKMRDPWHREVQKIMAEYKITPAPLVVDIDQRRDHLLFMPVLARLLKTEELPQMLLLGESLGSYHDVIALKESGKLRETLEASGHVTIRDAKKKKKGVKERERLENERILGPEPVVDV